jgi:putative hydroxymethylpyrimidine transport system permease protein
MEIGPTAKDVLLTLMRWGLGLVAGAAVGLFAGLIESILLRIRFRALSTTIRVALDFLRALPIIALIPLIQLIAIDEWWKIGLIAWAVMFPVFLTVRQATSKRLIDTELTLFACGLTPKEVLRIYRLPKALGGLIKGIEIAIGIGWISTVAAEWIGTFTKGFWAGGLGYKILKAHDANDWGGMLQCLALFGILGTVSAGAWHSFSVVVWRIVPGFNPTSGHD